MRHLILCFAAAILTFPLQAQMGNSTGQSGNGLGTLFAKDYQALGMNPANLGWNKEVSGHRFALGILEMDFSVHSTLLSKDDLLRGVALARNNEFLNTYAKRKQAAKDFSTSGFVMNVNSRWLGLSVTTNLLGGFAFSVDEHVQMRMDINEQGADVLFAGALSDYFDIKYDKDGNQLTGNYAEDDVKSAEASNPIMASELFDGTDMGYMWYREIQVGYGRQLLKNDLFTFYPGIGIKMLMGQGIFHMKAEDGDLVAFNAISPGLGFEYGNVSVGGNSKTSGLAPVGSGFGVDLGANLVLKDKYRFSMALTGLGAIKWTGNILKTEDFLVDSTGSKGFDSYNFIKELGEEVNSGTIKWGAGESETFMTPAVVRLGSGITLSKFFKAGVDFAFPMNTVPGTINGGILSLGTELNVKVVTFSTGYTINPVYGNSIPFGIGFNLGFMELGFASRDILGFVLTDGNTLSFTTGLLRFHF